MMNKILTIFLAVGLMLTMAGCGGGGGGDASQDHSTKFSGDFYGLEPGFEVIYGVIETKNDITSYHTYTKLVTGETLIGPGIYTVTGAYESETLGSKGDYIQKKGDDYYQYGDWEGAKVHWEDPSQLIIRNPLYESFISPKWNQTVTGRETVSVTAGTFNAAWVFEGRFENSSSSWGAYTQIWKDWFVPYLGLVKATEICIRRSDGAIVYSLVSQLKSSAAGVALKYNILKSAKTVTQSTVTGEIHHGLRH
jgi:hypothetical protein